MSKSRISLDEVRHVARLAQLTFQEDEFQALTLEMEAILEAISSLERVPLAGVEAALSTGSYANRFRADEVTPGLSREDALSNAPSTRFGCFEIPRILTKIAGDNPPR